MQRNRHIGSAERVVEDVAAPSSVIVERLWIVATLDTLRQDGRMTDR